ncbi:toll/interleukin-1 receptor domain-containing protein [Nitrogeniibacter mangrovi]|uniref:Toll/interleukin-1 receptor domain-containing protein n=1 Tax=Nitrogeniibacter mangrovi TaxID=2016596 RepID=A0A6C1AZD5_9RHOO|nr:toll/interleukin-1 receptor domain-containing protein [Nitrogeniibacter mangrovi]QID16697.1 toll/interleukin-1 receptor domain-containing protein [Nitrogeniibacter mangrovi]
MASIFISYRRDDSAGYAGRLEDDLNERFGDAHVFRDREIPAGVDFADHLNRRLDGADAVLVVIGRDWLDATDASGVRRLDHPADWVRREIERALALERLVVPVLVDGAHMPWPDQLPDDIAPLAGRQAVTLSDAHWREGVDALTDQLARQLPELAAARRLRPPSSAQAVSDLVRDQLERMGRSSPRRDGLGLAMGRWAAGRLGKLFSTVVMFVVVYLFIRALGGATANQLLDRVIDTTVLQARNILY